VLPSSPFAPPADVAIASERMTVGDRVTHDRLGLGRVVRIVDDRDVLVDFGHEDGLPRSVSHLKLTIL